MSSLPVLDIRRSQAPIPPQRGGRRGTSRLAGVDADDSAAESRFASAKRTKTDRRQMEDNTIARIAVGFERLGELDDLVEAGDHHSTSEWLEVAGELVQGLLHTKALFPSDRVS